MSGPNDFVHLPASVRREQLTAAISRCHAYHFERNSAYRTTVIARGVGSVLGSGELGRILRPAALTFKSYGEVIGPFPEDDPAGFHRWLSDQLSCPLPSDRWDALRSGRRYTSLEALLCDVERIYADLGLEIVTSTGTSGRSSIVVRDEATIALATEAFFTGIRDVWGVERGTALIFVMPEDTRIAMARTARFGTRHLDWAADSPVYYTIPFAATPDQMRVRAGRTFRPGLEGTVERRVLNPFMNWAYAHMAEPRALTATLACLDRCIAEERPVMLLGGLVQLHALTQTVAGRRRGPLALPAGSRVATGGGVKERYPVGPARIREALRAAFAAPVTDVYGMAEANWAAFECEAGNHHLPLWVLPVVTDDDDRILDGPDVTGLLAFFDPVGGGNLIPPFFQTADRVRLVNGAARAEPGLTCPCGREGAYIAGSIQRVDLTEEAGCAAQV
jgi:hypothetical protein